MPAVNDLNAYLNTIGAPQAVQLRVDGLLDKCQAMWGFSPDYVFIEDLVTPDGNRQFTNLGGIYQRTYFDLQIPEPNWSCSITSLEGADSIEYMNIADFDFVTATDGSRLMAAIKASSHTHITFSATGQNCLELVRMVRTRLVPMLTTPA